MYIYVNKKGSDILSEDSKKLNQVVVNTLEKGGGLRMDTTSEKVLEKTSHESLESGRRNLTVEKCYDWKSRFRFDLSIQRNEVWKKENKSLFIHSMLLGYPINFIYTMDQPDDNFYWVLDGKQRLTTFFDFLENKFALEGEDITDVGGESLQGKFYEDLSDDMKQILNHTDITIVHFKGLSRDQRDQLFFRLNNGESLTKMEQTRALSGEFMDNVIEFLDTDLFKNKLRMSLKARSRFKDVETVLQTAMLLEEGDNIDGLGSLPIRRYVNGKRGNEYDSEILGRMSKVLGYIEAATFEYGKKELRIFRKTNVPVIVKVAEIMKDRDVESKDFGISLSDFFIRDMKKDSEYSTLIRSGSAGKENVLRRVEILEKYITSKLESLVSIEE